ncbi:hypothetical protein M885DRAFT_553798 [Pelagophyceae sp. CCMP2097]|nr:hypothetical protein M885DRAFT_553798 [Pelagophyceae sp. CCMP2097]
MARPAARRWAAPLAARGRVAPGRSLTTQLGAVSRGGEADRDMKFAEAGAATAVRLVEKAQWDACVSGLPAAEKEWVDILLPDGWAAGALAVLPGVGHGVEYAPASLPKKRIYSLERYAGDVNAPAAALGWALGSYTFDRYKKKPEAPDVDKATLVWPLPPGPARDTVSAAARATYLVRDLISTPAQDMGPADLEAAARALGSAYGAEVKSCVGDALLESPGYPMIHAVGRAAAKGFEPRVVEMTWRSAGDAKLPAVVILGKGVTFDTGGLDIKPPAGMLTMKKDMGGAAHALGLAEMIMAAGLRVELRVLLGCAENSIAGNAFRPGDVLTARNGRTTEIGNTDAEGRLVLADLLVDADERKPDLIIDLATLTGAGRVALGTDVPAMFSNDDGFAMDLQRVSSTVADDVWRLPLWPGYDAELESPLADLRNIGAGPYGGAITAALYLQRFLAPAGKDANGKPGKQTPWIHLDMMAYNTQSRPGKPMGGEAMGMRALFELLDERFGAAP